MGEWTKLQVMGDRQIEGERINDKTSNRFIKKYKLKMFDDLTLFHDHFKKSASLGILLVQPFVLYY